MLLDDYDAAYVLWRNTEAMGLSEADSRAGITQFLERNPGLSLVAFHESEIVGTVPCGHDGRRGYLHHVAVARSHRQNGIGTKLVDACVANLAAAGIQKCHIFLHRDNTAGEQFWRKIGWQPRRDLKMLSKGTRG
jgi:putative acetyltransferase